MAARWLQAELTIAADALPAVEAALEQLGALSVSLADPGGEPVLEPAPGETPLWTEVVVTALFPAGTAREAIAARLAATPGHAPATLRFEDLVERDWVREFRENLAPLRFGRLWICPGELPCPDPAGVVLRLDPGLAFGSGSHPTTAMCLEWLAGLDLAHRHVLDWGCGSGVLAIAALALGARSAVGIDIDPQALRASAANAAANGVGDRLRLGDAGTLAASERFDVVVANILADSLIALAPAIRRHCQAGTRVALSGILVAQSGRVRSACAPWLDLQVAAECAGWALLAGTPA